MGVLLGHLPDPHTALRSRDRQRLPVALQYVPFLPYSSSSSPSNAPFADFVLSKVTPTLVTDLGYKIFLMFATINIGGMAVFSL